MPRNSVLTTATTAMVTMAAKQVTGRPTSEQTPSGKYVGSAERANKQATERRSCHSANKPADGPTQGSSPCAPNTTCLLSLVGRRINKYVSDPSTPRVKSSQMRKHCTFSTMFRVRRARRFLLVCTAEFCEPQKLSSQPQWPAPAPNPGQIARCTMLLHMSM